MTASVLIRKNATGEVRPYLDEHYAGTYDWEDGNSSCDCNRRVFFGDKSIPEFEHELNNCSEGKYSVRILVNGKVVYSEFE